MKHLASKRTIVLTRPTIGKSFVGVFFKYTIFHHLAPVSWTIFSTLLSDAKFTLLDFLCSYLGKHCWVVSWLTWWVELMSWIIFASQFIGPPSRFRGIEAGLLKKTGLVIALICNVSFATTATTLSSTTSTTAPAPSTATTTSWQTTVKKWDWIRAKKQLPHIS